MPCFAYPSGVDINADQVFFMNFLQRMCVLLALCVLMTVVRSAAAADNGWTDHFRISGFATLGATKAGNEQLGFHRDLYRDATFDGDWSLATDSLLGLQLNADINDQWGAAIQLVGKDRLDDSLENNVEWAYVAYRLNPQWTVRAGRIGLDVYMLSEYRSLGFSYLWVRPPVEFYSPIAFDSFDGFDITWSVPLGDGQLRTKFYGGKTRNDFMVGDDTIELELNPGTGLSLIWESERWSWRVTAAANDVDDDTGYFPGTEALGEFLLQLEPFWQESAHYRKVLSTDNPRIYYSSMGVGYNRAPWQVQAELGYVDSRIDIYPSFKNGYFSVGRQWDQVTIYGLVAAVQGQGGHREIEQWQLDPLNPLPLPVQGAVIAGQQAAQAVLDRIGIEQHSVSLGLRWDIRYDIAVKMQWDHTWVDQYGTALWLFRELPAEDQELDTYSINLNCIF